MAVALERAAVVLVVSTAVDRAGRSSGEASR